MLAPEVAVQPASRSGSRLSQYEEAAESEVAVGAAVEASDHNMAAGEPVAPLGEQTLNHKSDSDDDSHDGEVSLILLLSSILLSYSHCPFVIVIQVCGDIVFCFVLILTKCVVCY